MSAEPQPVSITHYADVLCVWAYVAQIRLDELRRQFGARVAVKSRVCSVFADVETKLARGWRDRGGLAGYREHVEGVVARFDHVTLHPHAWTSTVPTTSATGHAVVKAVELSQPGDDDAVKAAWAIRLAFFRDGRDISRLAELLTIVREQGLDAEAARARLDDGSAWAAVLRDYDEASVEHVRGSPTFVFNERRQTLYGNVGYRIIEANVEELLKSPGDSASWC